MNRILVILGAVVLATAASANEPANSEPPPLPAYVFDDLAPPPDAFDFPPAYQTETTVPPFAPQQNADAEANRAAALRQEAALLSRVPEPRDVQAGFGGGAGNNGAFRLQQQIRTLSDHVRQSKAQQPEVAMAPEPESDDTLEDEAVPPWVKALFEE